ncbi:unnamed protein product [Echinostoma caproni]|uniref:Lysosome membrane protein 2 n=1 Tax=Echinostoma caproni TaxID=27848 RepID=A0A183BDD3_9TREM|nr:unnamed protein product [Echinostoma caproni]
MQRSAFIICVIVSGLLAILSVIALSILSILFHWMVLKNTRLDDTNSLIYKQWLQPSVPIYLQFYFFQLSNPVMFQNGSKPHVIQQGPYTYRERRFKQHVVVNWHNHTIRYREIKQYHFERDLSVGPESDQITTVNLVYLSLAQRLGSLPTFIIRLIEQFERMSGEGLFVRRNVSELLWGYEDPLLHFLKKFISVPTSRIGLYLDRNNSDGVDVEIDTGLENPALFGTIRLYNGSRYQTCWTTDQANQVNGTDGSLFHPFLQPDEGLYIFAPDICRSIYFTPRSVSRIRGVATVKYLPLEDTFDSPLINEKNRGFCLHWPYCMKSGVLDMSTCQPGAPIVISMPHLVHVSSKFVLRVQFCCVNVFVGRSERWVFEPREGELGVNASGHIVRGFCLIQMALANVLILRPLRGNMIN